MLKETYANMNSQIQPDGALVARTLRRVGAGERPGRHRVRRPALAAVALLLALALATPALAARVPAVYELLYDISPATAQYFMPVSTVCEDNGVRLEVVSAYIHGDTAEIYLTLQDLTGDRVDATTDLFDSYSIHTPFDSSASCGIVGYDAQTGTATFLVTISQWGGRDVEGEKLTFSVSEFISRKDVRKDVPVDIDLASAGEAATRSVWLTGYSGSADGAGSGEADVLLPSGSICDLGGGLSVSALGYSDGLLRVQLAAREKLLYDNHGFFYVLDADGERINYAHSLSFAEDTESADRVDYQEFVFRVTPEQLSGAALYGSFYTSGLNTRGRWQVTFPLETAQ